MKNEKNKAQNHTFHIPVMGTSFSIDTPVKVAHLGISSVISLVDDILIEKMREFYSSKYKLPFMAITNKIDDFRAKRITEYLNLIDKIVKEKFVSLKNSVMESGSELEKYFSLLPDTTELKQKFDQFVKNSNLKNIRDWIHENLAIGSIDVNIMTKLDKENYKKNEKLPSEYNDAHASLRGFANSCLESSIILSAGLNPRLYSYFEQFEDFYPDKNGYIKKKIVLKVSDYRSGLIQGKFLAKKGLWVSEYRVESGLNCGGHAFATDGFLMGPILEEFKNSRNTLIQTVYEILVQSLNNKNRPCPATPPQIKITTQGGVGTAQEHQFLLEHYELDAVGWATPFLLVSEVTNVDTYTRNKLCEAGEDDLYLSNISPLGIPFNTLRGNSKDKEKQELINKNRPGSPCPKKFLVSNKDYTDKSICTASRQYQYIKIKELEEKLMDPEAYKTEFEKIVNKSCLCVGLGTAAMIVNDINTKANGTGVSICPGPNMAYFTENVSLKEMVDHIYGRINIIKVNDRPHMFIKELKMYIDYLKNLISEVAMPIEERQRKYFLSFQDNLNDGIEYYNQLISDFNLKLNGLKNMVLNDLNQLRDELYHVGMILMEDSSQLGKQTVPA